MKFLVSLGIFLFVVFSLTTYGCINTPPANNSTIIPPQNNTTAIIPPGYEVKDYCQKDSDCVRLNSCCDCGIGVYVNTYNQVPECTGVRCMCATRLSKGACQASKCVAVVENITLPQEPNLSFNFSQGECGTEAAPIRTEIENGMSLSGAVGAENVCKTAHAELVLVDNHYVLNISTRAIPGVAACIQCLGDIPWKANITGYSGVVDVYYDGRLVYPTSFCGTSTNGACSQDSDCVTGGCSGQVCQSASEQPVITDCMYSECYNAAKYGVSCGCTRNGCAWR